MNSYTRWINKYRYLVSYGFRLFGVGIYPILPPGAITAADAHFPYMPALNPQLPMAAYLCRHRASNVLLLGKDFPL